VSAPAPDRGPQPVDRERFGYPEHLEDPYLDEEEEHEEDADDEPLDEALEEPDEREPEPEEAPARRSLGRPLRRLLTGLALIAGLAALIWVVETRTGWDALSEERQARAEQRFSEEASRIAGKPVTIRCDDAGDHVGAVQHSDGVAVVGGELAYLTPERCLDLYRLAFDGEVRGSQTGRALAVLAHEAWHLRGVRDEARTECNALRSGVELGRRLGLSDETARRLMRQQRAENPLHARGSPEYLLPADC
jgi:hypothetical protein